MQKLQFSLYLSSYKKLTLYNIFSCPNKESSRHFKAFHSSSYESQWFAKNDLARPLRSMIHLSLAALLYLPLIQQLCYFVLVQTVRKTPPSSTLREKEVTPLVITSPTTSERLSKNKAKLQSLRTTVQTLLKEKDKHEQNMRKKEAGYQQKEQQFTTENARIAQELKTCQILNQGQNFDLLSKTGQIKALTEELSQHQQNLNNANCQIGLLRKEAVQKNQKLYGQANELRKANLDLQNATRKAQQETATCQELSNKIHQLETDSTISQEAFHKQIADIQQQYREDLCKLQALEEDKTRAETALRQQIAAKEQQHTTAIQELERKLQTLEADKTRAETALHQQIAANKQQHTTAIQELESKLQTLEADKTSSETALHQQIAANEQQHTTAIQELERKLQTLEADKTSLETALRQQIAAKEQQHTTAIQELERKLQALEEEKTSSETALRQQIAEMHADYSEARQGFAAKIVELELANAGLEHDLAAQKQQNERMAETGRLTHIAMQREFEEQKNATCLALRGKSSYLTATSTFFAKDNILKQTPATDFERYLVSLKLPVQALSEIQSMMQEGLALESALNTPEIVEKEAQLDTVNHRRSALQGYLLLQKYRRGDWHIPDLDWAASNALFTYAKSCYPAAHKVLQILHLQKLKYCEDLNLVLSLTGIALQKRAGIPSNQEKSLSRAFDPLYRELEGKPLRGTLSSLYRDSDIVQIINATTTPVTAIFNYLQHFLLDPCPKLQEYHWAKIGDFLTTHKDLFSQITDFKLLLALINYKRSANEPLNLAILERLLSELDEKQIHYNLNQSLELIKGTQNALIYAPEVSCYVEGKQTSFSRDVIEHNLRPFCNNTTDIYAVLQQVIQGLPYLTKDAAKRLWNMQTLGIGIEEFAKPHVRVEIIEGKIILYLEQPYHLRASFPDQNLAFEPNQSSCVYADISTSLTLRADIKMLLENKASQTEFSCQIHKATFPTLVHSRAVEDVRPKVATEDILKSFDQSSDFVVLELPPYYPIEVNTGVAASDVCAYLASIYHTGADVLAIIENALDHYKIIYKKDSWQALREKFLSLSPATILRQLSTQVELSDKIDQRKVEIKEFIHKAQKLGFELENDVYQELQTLLCKSFATSDFDLSIKVYIQKQIVDKLGAIYSREFFKKVINEQKWQKTYQQNIDFTVSQARLTLKAVENHAMSSAEPRNREAKEGQLLRIPNFFTYTYEVPSCAFIPKVPCVQTRSAVLVEFDQSDPLKQKLANRELVRQVLAYHAAAYIEQNKIEDNSHVIPIDFVELRFFTPDYARDIGHQFGFVNNCDNEADLYRKTLEAYEFFQENPEMEIEFQNKPYRVKFNILVMNASCNKARDRVAVNTVAANLLTYNPLEERKNKEALLQLEQKINAFEASCKIGGFKRLLAEASSDAWVQEVEKTCTDIVKRDQILLLKLMKDLVEEIREMLGINDAYKTQRFDYNYYALPARIQLLTYLLRICANEGCRSAKDRTGLAVLEFMLLLQLCSEKKRLIRYHELESEKEGSWSDQETCKQHADRYRAILFEKSGNVDFITELNLGWNLGMNLHGAGNPVKHGQVSQDITTAAFAAASVYHRPNSAAARYQPVDIWPGLNTHSPGLLQRVLTPPFIMA